ncbi:MAG: hypothetical protein AABZ74_12035 [Cyanobacteriota bacterium]
MAGQIKNLVEQIIKVRCNGNPTLINPTKIKLILKGINPDKFNDESEDDPIIIGKLQTIIKDLNLVIEI